MNTDLERENIEWAEPLDAAGRKGGGAVFRCI